MKRTLLRDTFREIRHSMGRFLSILAISMLGVAFFAGIRATGPDMKNTVDAYFDAQNLMDVHLLSTLGFTDADIAAVQKTPGVNQVSAEYSMDVLSQDNLVLKLHSLDLDHPETAENRVVLTKGRMIEKENECLIEQQDRAMREINYEIGDKIRLSSGTEEDLSKNLEETEFTVVGIVQSPYYISLERGSSAIGRGNVDLFAIVPKSVFKSEIYTDVFATVQGAKEKNSFEPAYKDQVAGCVSDLKEKGKVRAEIRDQQVKNSGETKIEKAEREIKIGEMQLSFAREKGYAQIIAARKELLQGKAKLQKSEKEMAAQLQAGRQALLQAEKEMESAQAPLKEAREKLEAQNAALAAGEQRLGQAKAQLDALLQNMQQLKALLGSGTLSPKEQAVYQAQYAAGMKEYAAGMAAWQKETETLAQGKAALSAAFAQLEEKEAAYQEGKAQLEEKKAEFFAQTQAGEKALAAAKAQWKAGWKKMLAGEKEALSGFAQAQADLADGRNQLQDAKTDLAQAPEGKWYVLSRNETASLREYEEAANRMDALAKVFPLIFFIVAALVCLNAMTRMLEEQRGFIGTAKAIGYGAGAVSAKYIIYAGLASVLGSGIGVFLGIWIFPSVIYQAYGILYTLPPIQLGFYADSALAAVLISVGVTTLAAFFACRASLKICPAQLMRPRAPKPGKRVWLERIGWLWRRLSFTRKVTMRNLFRYKKRFIMTIFGVAGGAALMLTGLGVQDSVTNIVTYQFEDLYQYQLLVTVKSNIDVVQKELDQMPQMQEIMQAYSGTVSLEKDGKTKDATLIVPKDLQHFRDFILLRDRGTKAPVPFETAVLSEKAARELGVKAGETLSLSVGEKTKKIPLSGVTEHYAMHAIYLSPETYEKSFAAPPEYNTFYIRLSEAFTQQEQDDLSEKLMQNKNIQGVTFLSDSIRNFKDMMGALSYVVMVLVAASCALTMLILYNLTNINVSERYREIATIKVLGFYDHEVRAYVFRENFILAAIGILLGLGLGRLLHLYIISTMEVDMVMFGRSIDCSSYLITVGATVLFALIVNIMMHFRLKKIDMVEALKTNE